MFIIILDCSEANSGTIVSKLLHFEVLDSVISNEYTVAANFTANECPKQLTILPALTLQNDRRHSNPNVKNDFESGAICVVCEDGSVHLYSLLDMGLIAIIKEENEKFISATYCRSLDRLCICSKAGGLYFYTLNDSDNDSSDECVDIEDDGHHHAALNMNEVSVTDGSIGASSGKDDGFVLETDIVSSPRTQTVGSGSAISNGSLTNSSPGCSSTAFGTASNYPVFGLKQGDFTLDELKTMYTLTLFDEKLSPYSAEVPSCWNDLGQSQKNRKQTQNTEETQFSRTWRLHNDAYVNS